MNDCMEKKNCKLWRHGQFEKVCSALDSPGVSLGKNPPPDARVTGLIPGSGRSRGKEMATHSSILAWEIPWTEEPGIQAHGVSEESDTI